VTTRRQPAAARRHWARLLLLGGSVIAIALAAGCVVGAGKDADTARAARSGAAAQAAPLPSTSTDADHGVAGAEPASAPLTPGELALQLQSLLGQHTVLANDMMRGRLRNDPDLAQATNAALGKNTDAMGKLVGSALGTQAAQTYTRVWASHVTALYNYAGGLADNDAAAQAQAKVAVTTFEGDLSDFWTTQSQGRIKKAVALAGVTAHVTHLLDQADAYAAKDYTKADAIYRLGYAHAFAVGRALSGGLLSPTDAKVLDTPTWRLRSALTQLLGEHVELVVGALRAGATDAPDFPAAAAAVNGNTTDLAGAIGVLFTPAAGTSFQQMWADHIDLLVRYAASIAKGDDGAGTQISSGLTGFEGKLAAFLNVATGNKLAAQALAKALGSHDAMLRQQVDAFVAKDYVTAHDVAYSTYQEMFGLSGQLAEAFGETVAKRLPVGPAQTGRGGMAAVIGGR
jgi:hypothetical protein